MTTATDFDGAWKEFLELYLRAFLELCFPAVAAAIDWRVAPEFLDQELQAVVRDAQRGKLRVDKLIKVQLLNGQPQCLFIHIEVQTQRDARVTLRVYQYHYRLEDKLGQPVLTLVVLGDTEPAWCPNIFEEEILGCRLRFEYPICKLLELPQRVPGWEENRNPAVAVIAAHLAAQATAKDMGYRKQMKWELTRRLYERGFERKDVLELVRLIDWQLQLPRELELAFQGELLKYEQEKVMPYVTSFERIGREQGRQEGRQEGILEALEARFGAVPADLRTKVLSLRDDAHLRRALRQAIQSPSLGQFEAELTG